MARINPLIVISLFAAASAPAAAQAVPWPSSAGGNDNCYEVVQVPGGIDWATAAYAAITAGGHLVTLGSNSENEFVHSLIADPALWFVDAAGNSQGPWIGALQRPGAPEPNGGWIWVTRENLGFSKWAAGEPNNNNGNEDRGQYFGLGFPNYAATWNDVDGTGTTLGYVIEYEAPPEIGTNYCTAVPNSSGDPAHIFAEGSTWVSHNAVTLHAVQLPRNVFGYFLTSQTAGFIPNPGGSVGNLCLGGGIGRYVGPGEVRHSGGKGEFSLILDLMQTPTPAGMVAIQPGETWYFTAWFRDSVMGTATSNLTEGLEVMFH